MAQCIDCWPVNQRVTGLIPSQDTCLGCRLGGNPLSFSHTLMFLNLSFFLPSTLSKNRYNYFSSFFFFKKINFSTTAYIQYHFVSVTDTQHSGWKAMHSIEWSSCSKHPPVPIPDYHDVTDYIHHAATCMSTAIV